MNHNEKRAAEIDLGRAYVKYMSDTVGVKMRIREEYRLAAEDAIAKETAELDAVMGRAIARNPLPVREKQKITSSTNWARYKRFIEAAGEVDVSSREGRMSKKLAALENSISEKTGSGKNSGAENLGAGENTLRTFEDITDRVSFWVHAEAATAQFDPNGRGTWFVSREVPGGEGVLWVALPGEEPEPAMLVHAGREFDEDGGVGGLNYPDVTEDMRAAAAEFAGRGQ